MHGTVRQDTGSAAGRTEEGGLVLIDDAGSVQILAEKLLELVMRRHLVALAAFLLQPHPPALAVDKVVVDLHRNDGADAREGVGHDADHRAVAQADEPGHFSFRPISQGNLPDHLDAFEQVSGLSLGQHRRLAALDDVLGPAHRMGWVDGEDLTDDQPVEQHADCRQMLLDRRPGCCPLLKLRSPGSDTFSDLIYPATWNGSISASSPMSYSSSQAKNEHTAR
jgi:hypothetical protein